MEEQECDCSGKPLVQLATGETRSLRKSVARAVVNAWLLLFTSWRGQEQGSWKGWLSAWQVSVCSTATADLSC